MRRRAGGSKARAFSTIIAVALLATPGSTAFFPGEASAAPAEGHEAEGSETAFPSAVENVPPVVSDLLGRVGLPKAPFASPGGPPTPVTEQSFVPPTPDPVGFEENLGQVDPRVRFTLRDGGSMLYLLDDSFVLRLIDVSKRDENGAPAESTMSVVSFTMEGVAPGLRPAASASLPMTGNHFIGSDPHGWVSGAAHYERVTYASVYEGIDLVFRSTAAGPEYDFVLRPGADADQIRLRIDGTDGILIDPMGELVVKTGAGEIRHAKPSVYQVSDAGRVDVPGSFFMISEDTVGFQTLWKDAAAELVIDPLVYSTFYGGTGDDVAEAVAIGSDGSTYFAGWTWSSDFPTTTGSYSASKPTDIYGCGCQYVFFITKFNAAATSVEFATYVGDSVGLDPTHVGMALDGADRVYVTGATYGPDYPLVNPVENPPSGIDRVRAVVSKLSADGSTLLFSTTIGEGSSSKGHALVVADDGTIWVAGDAREGFPTTPDAIDSAYAGAGYDQGDAVLARLDPAGSIVYATYLGGLSDDEINTLSVSPDGRITVAGDTRSATFPTTAGAFMERGPSLPRVSAEAASATIGDHTYIFGGLECLGNGFSYCDDVVRFGAADLSAEVMTARFPTGFSLAAGASDRTYGYAIGGFDVVSCGEGCYTGAWSGAIRRYDPTADAVAIMGASVEPRAGAAAVGLGDYVYIFGGTYDYFYPTRSDILRYDPATDTVETMGATLPSPNGWEGWGDGPAATDGSSIYLFAGQRPGSMLDTIMRYDPSTDSLTTMTAAFPAPLARASALWTGTAFYIFGGVTECEGCYLTPVDTVYRYDPLTDTLTTVAGTLPTTLYSASATWDGTNAYLLGGFAGWQLSFGVLRFDPVFGATSGLTNGGGRDAFVAEIAGNGTSLAWSTLLGGDTDDALNAMAFDGNGQILVAGSTYSLDFPTQFAFDSTRAGSGEVPSQDAFLSRLSSTGNALLYSTFLGGEEDDAANAVGIDGFGNMYVAGKTHSGDFPVTANAEQGTFASYYFYNSDAFLSELDPLGASLVYSSFLGGRETDVANAMAMDEFGNLILVGTTGSSDFPVANAIQPENAGGSGMDAFVTKIPFLGGGVGNGNNGNNFPTIQDAINNSRPGDTIYIAPGTYLEALTVDKNRWGEDLTDLFLCGATEAGVRGCGGFSNEGPKVIVDATGISDTVIDVSAGGFTSLTVRYQHLGPAEGDEVVGARFNDVYYPQFNTNWIVVQGGGCTQAQVAAGQCDQAGGARVYGVKGRTLGGFLAYNTVSADVPLADGSIGGTSGFKGWFYYTGLRGNTVKGWTTAAFEVTDVVNIIEDGVVDTNSVGVLLCGTTYSVIVNNDFKNNGAALSYCATNVSVPNYIHFNKFETSNAIGASVPDGVEGQVIDLRANDWQIYRHTGIGPRVADSGTGNTVKYVPFMLVDGSIEPPLVVVSPYPHWSCDYSWAEVIIVYDNYWDYHCAFTSIDGALQFAQSGDTMIAPGSIYPTSPTPRLENVTIESNAPFFEESSRLDGVRICSSTRDNNTACNPSAGINVVDSSGSGKPAFTVGEVEGVLIDGFTFTGASPVFSSEGSTAMEVRDSTFAVSASATQARHGAILRDTTDAVLRFNRVLGNMYPGSIGIGAYDSVDPTVSLNNIDQSGTGVYFSGVVGGEARGNVIRVAPASQFGGQSLGVSFFTGTGQAARYNTFEGTGIGLTVKGATEVYAHSNTWNAVPTGIRLSASWAPIDAAQPDGILLRYNRLDGAATKLLIEPGVAGLAVDARYNHWGAYSRDTIEATIEDAGTGDSVDVSCFYDLDGTHTVCPPTPSFDVSPATGHWRTAFTFTDTSTPGGRAIDSWDWDFSDGSTAAGSTVSHTFARSGVLQATLTIEDAEGYVESTTRDVTVTNAAPVLQPVGAKTIAEASELRFYVQGSDPDGDSLTFVASDLPAGASLSNLPDGRGLFAWTPSFSQAGVHRVTLGVTDGDLTGSEAVDITVGNVDRPPIASLIGPSILRLGQVGTFTSTSTDPDGQLAGEDWSFDDGATAAGKTVTHAFATEASHYYTLTVTDPEGASASITRSVIVDGTAPVTTAAATGTRSPSGWYTSSVSVTLLASDSGGSGLLATYYRWNGGNRIGYNPSTGINVPTDGTTSIAFWSEDRAGNAESSGLMTIRIDRTAPVASITSPSTLAGTDVGIVEPGPVNFTADVSDGTGSGVAQVKFYVDGVLVKVQTGSGPYYHLWDASTATPGRHVLEVRAIDAVGFARSESVSVIRRP
ncbi:MAG: PKD domain-containing protein [Euryarchaeota archaeon]|nr:PKD domain-containing protein [Euryarchaeota archaeon]